MKESNFTTIFEKYIRAKKMYGVFELKQTDADAIPFAKVENHQIESLIAAQNVGFLHKISDADPRRKAFDVLYTKPLVAYIAIRFPKVTCVITVNNFIFERDRSKRKSLTIERAKEIATCILASK